MTGDISSLLWYLGAMLFASMFAYIGNHERSVFKRKCYIVLSFLVIILFCGCRFFVGNDYANYTYAFQSYKNNGYSAVYEPGFDFLYYVFADNPCGYIYVFFIATIVTYYFIFKTLVREDCLSWGIYFTFALGFLICANDQIRQCIAISIFIYSIKFIERGEFIKYLCCVLGACLFHYSAIVLIGAYFIRFIKFSRFVWGVLIISAYFLYLIGFWQEYVVRLMLVIPHYGELAVSSMRFLQAAETSSGLGILFKVCLALSIVITYNKLQKPLLAKIYLCGSFLGIVSVGFLLLERVSFYMLYTNILVFPLLIKNRKVKIISTAVITVSFLYYVLQFYFGLEKHGAVPYRTIFFENVVMPNYSLGND
ncbi:MULTISPECIES: EpsG family protein [Butyricimonas]|uniref:EpsG family protein n=1 Tax=Butyricimonas TaxID=574697 RepID=UPI000B384565|nr:MULTISPECIES: EpsG family protein [Butyricimonas]OUN62766.1 hypothetical protein B5G13_19060 [Butyricimonas sp. An62]